jgi:uncharacterized membrane protein
MTELNRDDIYLLNKQSDLGKDQVAQLLRDNIYNNSASWKKFLRIFVLSLGLAFLVSGLVFFFAFNWADIPKFYKLGMVQCLILLSTTLVLLPKLSVIFKNILLTAASVLVGVLFAVFGQIYQTGANAYDFFLGWTLAVTLWVVISNFAPLWMFFIALLNVTLQLYFAQVARFDSGLNEANLLFAMNLLFLSVSLILSHRKKLFNVPGWFTNTLALAVISISTLSIATGIHSHENGGLPLMIIMAGVCYAGGMFYGFIAKSEFYLGIIPFSLVIIISSLLLKISDEVGMFLLTSIFIMGSVTMIIKFLLDTHKKWKN